MRACLFLLVLFYQINGFGQGLFEYFKLTADGDGAEKFDRIFVDFTWTQWMEQVPGVDQGIYSFGISAGWMKDIPLGLSLIHI